MTSQYLEYFIPCVMENGLQTGKAAVFGSTLSVTGATTLSSVQMSSTLVGQKEKVVASGGTTRTLTAADSGSVNLFDSAAGIAYTLPPTAVGLYFEFVTTVTQTSSAHSIVTPASSFLVGGINLVIAASATTLACSANGSSNTTISTNGTTTGGIIGGHYLVEAISATVWAISGQIFGSGTLATPIA